MVLLGAVSTTWRAVVGAALVTLRHSALQSGGGISRQVAFQATLRKCCSSLLAAVQG